MLANGSSVCAPKKRFDAYEAANAASASSSTLLSAAFRGSPPLYTHCPFSHAGLLTCARYCSTSTEVLRHCAFFGFRTYSLTLSSTAWRTELRSTWALLMC